MKDAFGHHGEARDEVRALIKAELSAAVGPGAGDLTYAPSYRRATTAEDEDLAVTLRQYLHMVLKRKWLILGSALAFFVLGGIWTRFKTPLYSATVRIQIDRATAKIIESGATSPSGLESGDDLETQYELLRGRGMAKRVVSALHLADDDDFFKSRNVSLDELPHAAREGLAAAFCARKRKGQLGKVFKACGCELPGPEPGACPANRGWICRGLCGLQPRQKVRGQCLRQEFSR